MDPIYYIFGAFAIFFFAAIGALLVLWIALPFALFGVKDLLKKSIAEQEKTNRLLKSIIDGMRADSSYRDEEYPEKRDTH